MRKSVATLITLSMLAACGGGGGGGGPTTPAPTPAPAPSPTPTPPPVTTVPLSATGFAKAGDSMSNDFAFTVTDQVRTIGSTSTGLVTQVSSDPIMVSRSSTDGTFTIELDGETYTLITDPADPTRASFVDGSNRIQITEILPGSEFAVAKSLFSLQDGELNSGTFVIGFDTDPAVLAATPGSASYSGNTTAVLRSGLIQGLGTGDLNIGVDFENDTVSGTGSLTQVVQGSTPGFTFNPIMFEFNETAIDENGFSGTLGVSEGVDPADFQNGTYDGRFFGPDGQDIGGRFNGQIEAEGFSQPFVIDGAFFGSE